MVKGNVWDAQLLELLEYRAVLGALVTTTDGLVIAHGGLSFEDAEMLAAAISIEPDAADAAMPGAYRCIDTRGGAIHLLHGGDMALIVLAEHGPAESAIRDLMQQQLDHMEGAMTVGVG